MAKPKKNVIPRFRHNGRMIDPSYKNGKIEYWVVDGRPGRYYSKEIAMEIAKNG